MVSFKRAPVGMISRLSLAYKVLYELGFRSVSLNGLYRLGLFTGHYRRTLNAELKGMDPGANNWQMAGPFPTPTAEEITKIIGEAGKAGTLAEADEIVAGKAPLFGAGPVDLKLALDGPLADWTTYETGKIDLKVLTPDIKFVWEPARFGWVFTLGRAYVLSGEAKYAEAFWHDFEVFSQANPAYLGPQWMSAQEAALRLMVFAWAGQLFAGSAASTPERQAQLAGSIAEHALRIPPTLVYARSQRNNHLLVEAAGLLTAGLVLPGHPRASKWRESGWKWFNRGLQDQIDGYGEYSQHSTNYHRLMLQVVLWVNSIIRSNDFSRSYRWPRPTQEALIRSVHWLLALLDPDSGQVPNLGANDGACIFPLSVCPFNDFRPVLVAAARAFLDYDLPHGPWDEMCLWFRIPMEDKHYVQLPRYLGDHLYGKESWAALRTAQFNSRPSHADQLHLDLWWRGLNVAQDSGTFLYNAEPPWDNSLTNARVHNTVTVNGRDQMTRAGRFLYVDWIDAYRIQSPVSDPDVLQQMLGRYRNTHQGYRHSRRVSVFTNGRWHIQDELMPLRWMSLRPSRPAQLYRLHWLLPDWKWQADMREAGFDLRLASPHGCVTLKICAGEPSSLAEAAISLVRAGEVVYKFAPQNDAPPESLPPEPTRGWVSPTYGVKLPVLSLAVEICSADDVQFISEFIFP